jgi:hypothetical protein
MADLWGDDDDTSDPTDVESFLQRIEDLVEESPGVSKETESFLMGVWDTVRRTNRVSEHQRSAVDDIEERLRDRGRRGDA